MRNSNDVEIDQWQVEYLRKVKERFSDFVLSQGYSRDTAKRYISELCCMESSEYTLQKMGVENFMVITGIETLERMLDENESSGSKRKPNLRRALTKYIEFLQANPDLMSLDPEIRAKQKAEKLKAELAQNKLDNDSVNSAKKDCIGRFGQGMSDGVFEEMCDIAMHQNIIDAYNYHVKECMKATGKRVLGLNQGRDYEYWEKYLKDTVAILYSEEYSELSDHFMEFFQVDDRFKAVQIVNAIKQYAPGAKGWVYWQTLARWKVAERVLATGYNWYDFTEEWYSNSEPFDLRATLEISNIERDFTIYTTEERKACSDSVKALFKDAERNKKILVDEENYVLQGELMDAQAANAKCPVHSKSSYSSKNKESAVPVSNSDNYALKEEIVSLMERLSKTVAERDEALKNLKKANEVVRAYEKNESQKEIVDHDQLIADVFSEIMQRYMESTKCKSQARREEIQKALKDILFELKLDGLISRKMKKCINDFDNPEPPVIPQIIVQGDYVLQKHVESQVNHVAEGGTGITR